ncbi:MAG: tRNA (adenosine(37)-N6)-threonylcarbamoyltransferase complex transferase subunit TsaD [Planctomycetota bacterium]
MGVILGLETSCDETAAALVRDGRAVLGQAVASQHDLHARYGGVVPELASRAHVERLTPVVRAALDQAGLRIGQVDAVAVGHRPGLVGSLVVGVSAAKALAWRLGVPLVGVDHVRAHLYAPRLHEAGEAEPPASQTDAEVYPALGLVVSGGHTSLYRVDSALEMLRLGKTIDDAAGEAFDKAAVMLGLGFPGGPNLDRLAESGDPSAETLPRSLLGPDSLDFSFSGLKTAMLYRVCGRPERGVRFGGAQQIAQAAAGLGDRERADLAASFRDAVVDVLARKLVRAAEALRAEGVGLKSIVVGGGVSANRALRRRLPETATRLGLGLHVAPMAYCVDNAAMIAGLAQARLDAGQCDDLGLSVAASGVDAIGTAGAAGTPDSAPG